MNTRRLASSSALAAMSTALLSCAALLSCTGSVAPQRSGDSAAVLRCLYPLPAAACELAGIAADDDHVIVSFSASPITREYCGGEQPTRGLESGLWLLDRGTGRPAFEQTVRLEGGFGGAAHGTGDEVWQVLYSAGKIARLKVVPGDEAASGLIGEVPTPNGGRVGGLAYDGRHLWAHNADEDRMYVLDATDGRVLRSLPPPYPRAINGIAWAGGRLYAAVNDDASGPGSTGEGAASESILRLDPETGAETARWPLPEGIYPHSMDAGGDRELVILVQASQDARQPMYLYQLELRRPDAASSQPLHIPCS